MKSYWVVSPNVKNNEATVSNWRHASVLGRAAFMGWPRTHQIGYKFAHKIVPGDVVVIARRHNFEPEVVGLGIVDGPVRRRIKGLKTPESFETLRRLSPFVPVSCVPEHIPFIEALRHNAALAKLHPESRHAHAAVCRWMDRLLARNAREYPRRQPSRSKSGNRSSQDLKIVDSPRHHQLDYIVRSQKQVTKAKKNEARLVMDYRRWLSRQGRKLTTTRYGKLQCDGFERERKNVIEAKSSVNREHIRMAVGQLLDYAFQIETKFGKLHMGILLPKEPELGSVAWLGHYRISLIWRKNGAFLDNANGQFT